MAAILRTLAVAITALCLLATASGISAADYSGLTYEKAAEAITNSGSKPVIASVVGDQLATNDCIVTRSVTASNKDSSGRSRGSQILLFLNCNAALALPGIPGNSAASPEGKAAAKELETAKYCAVAEHAGNSDCDKFCSTRAALCEQGARIIWAKDLETATYCAVAEHAGNPDCAKFCSLRAEVCKEGAKLVLAKDMKTATYCALPAQAGNPDCAKFCSLREEVCSAAAREVAGTVSRITPGATVAETNSATLTFI